MGVDEVVAEVGLWWPAAHEDGLRAAAAAWEHAAGELDRAAVIGRSGADRARSAWSGPAAGRFAAAWRREEAGLGADAAGARALSAALLRYADMVAEAKRRVIELAVTAGATIVAGVALAWLTFGTSAAAAAEVSAALVAAAEAIGVELSASVASIVGGELVGIVFGAGEAALVDAAVTQPLRVEAFGDGGYSGPEVTTTATAGGLAGGLFGGVLGGLARPSARAAELLNVDAVPATPTAPGGPPTPRPTAPAARAPTAADDLGEVDGLITAALDPGRRGSLGPLFRPGIRNAAELRLDQIPAARLLAAEGANVQARADGVALVRTSPADGGRFTEVVGAEAPHPGAVEDAILDAGARLHRDRGGGDLVLDGRRAGLSMEAAGEGLARAVARAQAHGLAVPDAVRFVLDGVSIHWP